MIMFFFLLILFAAILTPLAMIDIVFDDKLELLESGEPMIWVAFMTLATFYAAIIAGLTITMKITTKKRY